MKRITAKRLNEISGELMDKCHLYDYDKVEAIACYFELKLFGHDDEEWSKSQLKKRLGQYEEALRSLKTDNGQYSTSEKNYFRYIGMTYPERPNDQVMVFRMRIGDYIPYEIKQGGHKAIHKYLKHYHEVYRYFRPYMEKRVTEELNKQ